MRGGSPARRSGRWNSNTHTLARPDLARAGDIALMRRKSARNLAVARWLRLAGSRFTLRLPGQPGLVPVTGIAWSHLPVLTPLARRRDLPLVLPGVQHRRHVRRSNARERRDLTRGEPRR